MLQAYHSYMFEVRCLILPSFEKLLGVLVKGQNQEQLPQWGLSTFLKVNLLGK